MTTNNTNCPCGSLYLTKGSAFASSGLRVTVTTHSGIQSLDLIHSQDIYLESGEKFVTVTPIVKEHLTPTKLSIHYLDNTDILLNNLIHIIVKDKLNKHILGTQYIGKYNETVRLNELSIDIHSSVDLYDNSFVIEIHSLCDNGSDPCCDKLPSAIDIVGPRLLCVPLNQYYVLPTTTTTTTPEPFTIEFLTMPTNQVVNSESGATFSFSAITIYDKDFTYWWEKSEDNGLSWNKASRLLVGKSRQIHTLVVASSLRMNGYKYRVVTIDPKIKYSNIAILYVVQPTTTTTTTTTFNPITTTLPPCDLQITGLGNSTTTTTITPTTTSTTTTTNTTTTQSPQGSFTLIGAGIGDATGCYTQIGIYNDKPYYTNGIYFIWYEGFEFAWFLNTSVGAGVPDYMGENENNVPTTWRVISGVSPPPTFISGCGS